MKTSINNKLRLSVVLSALVFVLCGIVAIGLSRPNNNVSATPEYSNSSMTAWFYNGAIMTSVDSLIITHGGAGGFMFGAIGLFPGLPDVRGGTISTAASWGSLPNGSIASFGVTHFGPSHTGSIVTFSWRDFVNDFSLNNITATTNPMVSGSNIQHLPAGELTGVHTIVLTIRYSSGSETFWAVVETNPVTVPLPPDPMPPRGHSFAGWYTDSALTNRFEGTTVGADITLFARFSPIVYSIRFFVNGGDMLIGAPTTYTVLSDTITLPIPTRVGHHFRGWYTVPTLDGQAVTAIEQDSIGDKSFYARWEIKRFTVTFMVGDNVHYSVTVDWGTIVSPQAMYFVDLVTFNIIDIAFAGAVYEDLQFYADNPIGVFNRLTFDVGGKQTSQLLAFNYSLDNLFVPIAPNGYLFAGWYHDQAFVVPVLDSDRLTEHMTIFARFVEAPPTTIWQAFNAWAARNLIAIIIVGSIVLVFGSCLFLGGKKRKRRSTYGR